MKIRLPPSGIGEDRKDGVVSVSFNFARTQLFKFKYKNKIVEGNVGIRGYLLVLYRIRSNAGLHSIPILLGPF